MAIVPLAMQKAQDAVANARTATLEAKAMKNEAEVEDSMGMKMETEAKYKIIAYAGEAMKARLGGLDKAMGAFNY